MVDPLLAISRRLDVPPALYREQQRAKKEEEEEEEEWINTRIDNYETEEEGRQKARQGKADNASMYYRIINIYIKLRDN